MTNTRIRLMEGKDGGNAVTCRGVMGRGGGRLSLPSSEEKWINVRLNE